MFVDSPKIFQCIMHSVWQWTNLHIRDAHVAIFTIPGPHRLNWTVDTVLTSCGRWLVIVRDRGCYDPPLVKPISDWVCALKAAFCVKWRKMTAATTRQFKVTQGHWFLYQPKAHGVTCGLWDRWCNRCSSWRERFQRLTLEISDGFFDGL